MSVFSSHPQRNISHFFVGVIVLAGVVAGSVYFGNVVRGPLTAALADAGFSNASPYDKAFVEARETIFPEPTLFDEEGTITSVLASGQGVAIRLIGDRGYVQAYAHSGQLVPIVEGFVHIRGSLTEISCAYANTLFEGRCTPTVTIELIEPAPLQPL